MANRQVTEIKAVDPSRDFERCTRFYSDLGFTLASDIDGGAYFRRGNASFLLQNFCADGLAKKFMMHLLVEDVEARWGHILDSGVIETYGVKISDVVEQPWQMRDFGLIDPSGVRWRIGQTVGRYAGELSHGPWGDDPERH